MPHLQHDVPLRPATRRPAAAARCCLRAAAAAAAAAAMLPSSDRAARPLGDRPEMRGHRRHHHVEQCVRISFHRRRILQQPQPPSLPPIRPCHRPRRYRPHCRPPSLFGQHLRAARKGSVLATKEVETQGKGSVLATKAVETHKAEAVSLQRR